MSRHFYMIDYDDSPGEGSHLTNAMEINPAVYAIADKYEVEGSQSRRCRQSWHSESHHFHEERESVWCDPLGVRNHSILRLRSPRPVRGSLGHGDVDHHVRLSERRGSRSFSRVCRSLPLIVQSGWASSYPRVSSWATIVPIIRPITVPLLCGVDTGQWLASYTRVGSIAFVLRGRQHASGRSGLAGTLSGSSDQGAFSLALHGSEEGWVRTSDPNANDMGRLAAAVLKVRRGIRSCTRVGNPGHCSLWTP
ncbi:hypothetical protein BAUCODRAFT_490538 [Baudoinia panamericana UAMH 10762]|uniref:Uncharacterized protein n=1 Tax=Baudoinia panamericana (strain UAMH 10762) TaxID=717646 RepID=M2MJF1_BAUPA|nr:uncharacterized protein BAUCODRAFT_490538 [Baudoinia panamericana UAMH 10762]EMC96816.1 hypothetical protein BAUCODRAFT_490538 [Baudoinia panamericana UAMH 10762]